MRFTSGKKEFKGEPVVPSWNGVYVALRVVVKGRVFNNIGVLITDPAHQ
jgi:hypothetical protein